MNSKRKASFTLIEMLAVIVVVGILVSLLMPVMGRTREKAYSIKCKANLKNLQVAATSHLHDQGNAARYYHENLANLLPFARAHEVKYSYPDRWFERRGWVTWLDYPEYPDNGSYHYDGPHVSEASLAPWWGEGARTSIVQGTLWEYVGESYKVYLCPTFEKLCASTAPDGTTPCEPWRSYGMNANFQSSGARLNRMTNASRTLLFADFAYTNQYAGEQICDRALYDDDELAYDAQLDGEESSALGYPYPVEAIGFHHHGLGNAIFVDGHIEALYWSNTVDACAGDW